MADKTTVSLVPAPEGANPKLQFVECQPGGRLWQVSVDYLPAGHAMLTQADIEAAPNTMAISVTVAPVYENGQVYLENGKPVIIDSHTHTFTDVEMAEPNFDPAKRVMKIIAERVAVGEARLAGIAKLNQLTDDWAKGVFKAEPATHDPNFNLIGPPEVVVGEGPDSQAAPDKPLEPGDFIRYEGTGEQIPHGSGAHRPTPTQVEPPAE